MPCLPGSWAVNHHNRHVIRSVDRVSRPKSRSPRAGDVYLDSIGRHGIFSIVMSLSLQTVRDRFPALQYRDFRLLWFGQVVSLTGSRMQQTAILWHMYQLTESAYALGAMAVIRLIPLLLFSPLAGVITDTHDRRRVLLLAQCGLALISTTLAWITWSSHDSATTLYVITAISAGIGCFSNPAKTAMIPNLVDRRHLANAMSINITASHVASVSGPGIAGLLLATGSIATVYWINTVSFVFMIIPILMMHSDHRNIGGVARVSFAAALEGLRFIRRSTIIRSAMLLDFTATFFASATSLLPIFALEVLAVDVRGYGLLSAAPAAGAVLTGALMSTLPTLSGQGRLLFKAVALYGMATIVFGASTSFWLTFAALFLTGAFDTVSMVLRHTVMQLSTPDELRGRMTSVNMIFVTGGPRLGEAEAGLVAGLAGAPFSVIVGGIGCVAAVALIAWRSPILRRYDGQR